MGPAERLGKLKSEFNLDLLVIGRLAVKEQIQDLEEFRFFWDEKTKIGTWCSKLKLGEDAGVQAARLRRAWNAVNLYYKRAEQDRSKVVVSDLDSLLDDSELRTAMQSFWCRYRLRFPTEMYPSDATVSRVSRELTKRMLCDIHLQGEGSCSGSCSQQTSSVSWGMAFSLRRRMQRSLASRRWRPTLTLCPRRKKISLERIPQGSWRFHLT